MHGAPRVILLLLGVVGVVSFAALLFSDADGLASYRYARAFGVTLGNGLVAAFGVACAVGSWLMWRRHKARMRKILEDDAPEPAFSHRLVLKKLKQDPSELEAIRGKVVKVCVMRNFAGAANASGGSTDVRFTSFVVDTNGVTHDLQESKQHLVVEEGAIWLAEQLQVPYEDVSYG